jgi:5-formyltetrahydrofolate cyclo-ligase
MNNENTSPSTKAVLRRAMQVALRAASPEHRATWSSDIRLRLQEEADWLPPAGGVVAMFGGIPSEPDLLPLLPWFAAREVTVAFFAIEGHVMRPRAVRSIADLRAGQLNVLEPDASVSEPLEVDQLDVVLLPGLAFHPSSGARLGRGKGHYDRVLARLSARSRCIGVCFHLQLQETVPLEPHDRHVQALVTERGWIRLGHKPHAS